VILAAIEIGSLLGAHAAGRSGDDVSKNTVTARIAYWPRRLTPCKAWQLFENGVHAPRLSDETKSRNGLVRNSTAPSAKSACAGSQECRPFARGRPTSARPSKAKPHRVLFSGMLEISYPPPQFVQSLKRRSGNYSICLLDMAMCSSRF